MTSQDRVELRKPFVSPRAKRAIAPYLYQSPTIVLMAALMLYPIFTVVRYSLMDNVIINKHPLFVGLRNYSTVFRDATFWLSLGNTLYFTVASVIFHLLIGLGFALMLNSKLVRPLAKGLLRVLYIMPWVFTVTIIAIVWRLLLDPDGIVNYALRILGIIRANIPWFSSERAALQALTFVNIWAGYPFYMVKLARGPAGHTSRLIRGCHHRWRQWGAEVLEHHHSATYADHHQHCHARLHLDDAGFPLHD